MSTISDKLSEFYFKNTSTLIIQKGIPTQYQFNYRQILLLINLIYTIPSFYIYSKCRKLLKEKSNNHFNTIFSNDFYINVALFIIDIISTRLPISGLINNYPSYFPEYFPKILLFLSYYLIYANYFSSTLICLHRMTSVAFYQNNFWKRHTNLSIILIYVLSLIPTWHIWTYDVFYYILAANDSRYQLNYNQVFLKRYIRNSSALATISLTLAIICMIANTITILKYHAKISSFKKNRRVELTMLTIAIIACFSLILQCVIQIVILMFTDIETIRATAQDLRTFCLDLSICGPPWVLYFGSFSSRKTVVNQSVIRNNSEMITRVTK
ncbi:unnamed protein product [Caenorhabditis angaria]|uniref:Serpentine receptor class gamma n=1 Tax=Caenorhabditis angaria TaxID=860376 RepID=A0A9P1IKL3_9PELO|nr:unnamed protein product [Caenorhabditis angaria]